MATSITLTPRAMAIAKGEEPPEEIATAEEIIDDREDLTGSEVFGSDDEEEEEPFLDESNYYPEDDSESPEDEEEPDEAKWFEDESVKRLAQSYNLTSDDLSQFNDKAELERFGRMIDRQLASGTQASTSQIPGFQQHQQPAPRPQQQDPPEQTASAEDEDDLDKPFDIEALERENYDPNMVRIAKIHNRQIEQRKQDRVREQEQAHYDALVSFHRALDDLDESKFGKVFGEGGNRVSNIGTVHQMNRDAVYQTMVRMYDSLAAQGQSDIPIEHIARRAAGIALGDVSSPPIESEPTKKRTEAARQQSRRRRPTSSGSRSGGSSRPSPQGGTDEVSEVTSDPKFKKFWERAQQENGTL